MKKIEFSLELPENPKGTAQMIRHTRNGTYIPSNLRKTMAMYMSALEPYGGEFLTGPLELRIRITYAIKDKKKWSKPKTSVPDIDNIAKPFIDCMTKTGFWMDDSQIVKLVVEKWNGSIPIVDVVLREMGGESE